MFTVALKLLEHIEPAVREGHGQRILFAIGFDSIECWLMPLVFDRSQKKRLAKSTGCLEAIDHKRRADREKPLSNADGTKNGEVYRKLSKPFDKA